LYLAEFRNREEELKNALATSRSKVRDLEISLRKSMQVAGSSNER
jgi:hypothetical protein